MAPVVLTKESSIADHLLVEVRDKKVQQDRRRFRANLEQLILDKPEVGLRITHLLSERLRRYETRLEDIIMKDVRSRLAGIVVLLVESEGIRTGTGYRISTHYTHERLGTMIGANREAVTRAFGLLQDEGVVELRRRLIHVPDLEALRSSAGHSD